MNEFATPLGAQGLRHLPRALAQPVNDDLLGVAIDQVGSRECAERAEHCPDRVGECVLLEAVLLDQVRARRILSAAGPASDANQSAHSVTPCLFAYARYHIRYSPSVGTVIIRMPSLI
ncbi:hypothetical protein D3C81_1626760 [compost metagenome]